MDEKKIWATQKNSRVKDRNEKKRCENLCKMWHISPVWYYPGFRSLERNEWCPSRDCQQHPHLHPSRHPGTPLHPDGQEWKTNEGYTGMRVEAMKGR